MFGEEKGVGRLLATTKHRGKGRWWLCFVEKKLETRVEEERE